MEYSKLWALLKEPLQLDVTNRDPATMSNTNDLTDSLIHECHREEQASNFKKKGTLTGPKSAAARGHTLSVKAKDVYELSLNGKRLTGLGDSRGQVASPLTQYTSIRKLTINNNLLDDVCVKTTISPLAELRELQLDFNNLNECPVLSNSKLESFSAAHNKIAEFPILALPKLTTLDLSVNKLGDKLEETPLPGLRLPLLTHLDVSNNGISSLKPFFQLTHLQHLNVSSNQLTTLAGIENMTNLEELLASRNKLRYTAILQHSNPLRTAGRKLNVLDVSHNEITSLAFFPSGGSAMGKVWSLNIAHNQFAGAKAASSVAEENKGKLLKGPLRGPKKGGNAGGQKGNIFTSDDIDAATYDDDESDRASVASSASKRGVAGGRTSQLSARSSTSTATQRSVRSTSTSKRLGGDAEDTTFLQRLVTIFPELEVLDISHNNPTIAGSGYGDLRFLSKCASLVELRVEATLDVRAGSYEKHVDTIKSYLPALEVLDRHIIVNRGVPKDDPKLYDLDDLESVTAEEDAPGSRPGTSTRPQSASILQRPGSAASTKTAIDAAKAVVEFQELREELGAFLTRADLSHQRCNRIVDHMQATVAWAYGGAAQPPNEPDLDGLDEESHRKRQEDAERKAELEAKRVNAASDDEDLSDLDDEITAAGNRLVVNTIGGGGSSNSSSQMATPPKKPRGRDEAISPQNKRLANKPSLPSSTSSSRASSRSSSSKGRNLSSAPSTTGGGGGGSNSGALSKSSSVVLPTKKTATLPQRASSSHSDARSVASSSTTSTRYETAAMKRVKAQPSASFALDHAKFKREMQKEADERKQKIAALTKQPLPAPKPMGLGDSQSQTGSSAGLQTSKPKKATAEFGTSTHSPSKQGDQYHAAGTTSARGKAVTTSTSTSPVKQVITTTTSTSIGTDPEEVVAPPQHSAYQLRKAGDSAPTVTTTKEKDLSSSAPTIPKLTSGGAKEPDVRSSLQFGDVGASDDDDDDSDDDLTFDHAKMQQAKNDNEDEEDGGIPTVDAQTGEHLHEDDDNNGPDADPYSVPAVPIDLTKTDARSVLAGNGSNTPDAMQTSTLKQDADPRDIMAALRPSSAGQSKKTPSGSSASSNVVTSTTTQVVLAGAGLQVPSKLERRDSQSGTASAGNSARSMVGKANLVLSNQTNANVSRPGSAGQKLVRQQDNRTQLLQKGSSNGLIKSSAWNKVAASTPSSGAQPSEAELESARLLKSSIVGEDNVAEIGNPTSTTDKNTTKSPTARDDVPEEAPKTPTYYVPEEKSIFKANTKKRAGASLNRR